MCCLVQGGVLGVILYHFRVAIGDAFFFGDTFLLFIGDTLMLVMRSRTTVRVRALFISCNVTTVLVNTCWLSSCCFL